MINDIHIHAKYPSLFQFFKFKLIELQKGEKKLWENTRKLIMGYTVYIYNSSSGSNL